MENEVNDEELLEDIELYADVTSEVDKERDEELAAAYARYVVENSPFSSEEWTENNYRPREW